MSHIFGQHIFRVSVGDRIFVAAYPNEDYVATSAMASSRGTVMLVVEDRMFYEPLVERFPAGAALWRIRSLLELAHYESKVQCRKLLGPALRKVKAGQAVPKLLPDALNPRGISGKKVKSGAPGTIVTVANPWGGGVMSPAQHFTMYSRHPQVTDPLQFAKRRRSR